MATPADMNTCRKSVVSILQASLTAYGASAVGNAPDGSNAQYRSSTEINDAILSADGDICNLIVNTPGQPYQGQFFVGPTSIVNADPLPTRNGMIAKVTGVAGSVASLLFASASVNTTTDLVTSAAHGLVTGQPVIMTTTSALPTGLLLATVYYIYAATANTFGFSTTVYNAKAGTIIDLTTQGVGNQTATTQYIDLDRADSKATIDQVNRSAYLFAGQPGVNAGWYFIEGQMFYTPCPAARVYYYDYTLSSSPQAPDVYTEAIIAGAVARLVKDGSDSEMAGYYQKLFEGYLAFIQQGSKMLPEIEAYTQ